MVLNVLSRARPSNAREREQLTRAYARINARADTRARFNCLRYSQAICSDPIRPPIYPVVDRVEHWTVTNVIDPKNTPRYNETREVCFAFVYISLPLG